jgi:copper(I)-binding protein
LAIATMTCDPKERSMKTAVMIVACFVAMTTAAQAHDFKSGDLAIAHPYALPTPPGATTGGAYLQEIANKGKTPDALIGASSPVADRVEIHDMQMDGNIMRMRAVKSVAIVPGKPVAMSPGHGYHLMMLGIHQPFAVGNEIPLTLQFEHAGKVDVMLHVQERGAMAMDHAMPK